MSLFIIVLFFVLAPVSLIWFFLSRDRGPKEPIDALWLAAGFGILAAILAAIIELQLISAEVLRPIASTPTSTILFGSLGIGFIEEICKFVPLALFLYKKPFFNEYTDGIIYFAIAGLAFGAPENILYVFQYGVKVGFLRVFLTPFFHAAMTALVGYYLISAKRQHKSILAPIIALLSAAILHGIYDFGLLAATRVPIMAVAALAITFGMTAYMFVLYQKASGEDRLSGFGDAGSHPQPISHVSTATKGKTKPSVALFVSLLAILASIVPILGLALGIVGLVTGTTSSKSNRVLQSRLAIVFSSLAILASLSFLAYAVQALPIS